MKTLWFALLVASVAVGSPTERLIEARTRAYDAAFRNDATALRRAAAELDELADDASIGRMALYYAAWTEWSLVMSEMEAGKTSDALATAERSVARSRRALQQQPDDAEVLTMLANGLVALAMLDRSRLLDLVKEAAELRKKALDLAPANPRVVMFDAGWILNAPPEYGGSKDKGLARWLEAIELFEREARLATPHDARPTWGRALAYGWLCDLYFAMTPPQHDKAREAAQMALKLRPDFWYVKERVLPRLAK